MPCHGQDSYPPTSRFQSGIGEAELRAAINLSNDDPIPRALALALQLPVCGHPEFKSDMARLHREIDLIARLIERDREVVELHVETGELQGPFPMGAVQYLVETLRHQFHFSSAVTSEFSIAVDPEPIAPDQIAGLAAAGFNRLRFTSARVDPHVLRAARDSGYHSIGVVADGATSAIECAETLRPDRLSVLGSIESSPGQVKKPAVLRECLERAGYRYIGLDQFALPQDDLALALEESRLRCGRFGFTLHAECDSIGFGAGAVSQVGRCYSQNAERLDVWRRDLDAGRLSVRRGVCLTEDDELRGELIQQLLCRRQIEIRELERSYDINFRSYFAADLARLTLWLRLGLIRDFGDRIAVCSPEWPQLRRIALCFNAYANDDARSQEAGRRHRVGGRRTREPAGFPRD